MNLHLKITEHEALQAIHCAYIAGQKDQKASMIQFGKESEGLEDEAHQLRVQARKWLGLNY